MPGNGGIRTRKIALLIADGVDGASTLATWAALLAAGAVPKLVGMRLGPVKCSDGSTLEAEGTLETMPAVLFDALVLPDGAKGVAKLLTDGHTLEFIKDQYRHCKTIMALGASSVLLERCGIPTAPCLQSRMIRG